MCTCRAQAQVGSPLRFRLVSARGGYLYLLHVNPADELACLFPNRIAKQRMLPPGTAVELPSTEHPSYLKLSPPAGDEAFFLFEVRSSQSHTQCSQQLLCTQCTELYTVLLCTQCTSALFEACATVCVRGSGARAR